MRCVFKVKFPISKWYSFVNRQVQVLRNSDFSFSCFSFHIIVVYQVKGADDQRNMECRMQNKYQSNDGNSNQINNFNERNSKMFKCAIFDSQIEQSHLQTCIDASATDFLFSSFFHAPNAEHNNNSHDCIVFSPSSPAIVYPHIATKWQAMGTMSERKNTFMQKKRRKKWLKIIEQLLYIVYNDSTTFVHGIIIRCFLTSFMFCFTIYFFFCFRWNLRSFGIKFFVEFDRRRPQNLTHLFPMKDYRDQLYYVLSKKVVGFLKIVIHKSFENSIKVTCQSFICMQTDSTEIRYHAESR